MIDRSRLVVGLGEFPLFSKFLKKECAISDCVCLFEKPFEGTSGLGEKVNAPRLREKKLSVAGLRVFLWLTTKKKIS